MNYKVWTGGRGMVFGSFEEAAALAAEIRLKTGLIVAVTQTEREVSHKYIFNDDKKGE